MQSTDGCSVFQTALSNTGEYEIANSLSRCISETARDRDWVMVTMADYPES